MFHGFWVFNIIWKSCMRSPNITQTLLPRELIVLIGQSTRFPFPFLPRNFLKLGLTKFHIILFKERSKSSNLDN